MPDFLDPNLSIPPDPKPSSNDEGVRHTEAARPLKEVSEALQSSASGSATMDPTVKEKQRLDLISLASKRMQQEKNTQPSRSPSPRVWWGLGAFATVALAALLVVVVMPALRPGLLPTGTSGDRISIPEAHAADAFSMAAEKLDVNGVDTDAAFVLKSTVAVSASELKQHLTIVPAVDFTVEATNDGTYRIQPSMLEPSTVYHLSLPTTVALANGSTSERDFSWAFQTKNDFRPIATVPGDGSGGVPVNTSIDIKLTQSDWENPSTKFTIEPSVKGRFEAHGRTLSFLPNKPLAYGTRYTVTLQKGLKLAGSSVALKDDVRIRFETERAPTASAADRPLSVSSEFFEVPGKGELVIGLYEYNGDRKDVSTQTTAVQVTGYLLGQTQAKALLEKRLQVPDWAMVEREKYRAYLEAEKTQAFQLTANLETPETYGSQILRLPAFARKGFYALKLHKDGRLDTWLFVQVTDIATYMTADKDTLLVWTVNAATNKAWNGLPVKTDLGNVTTDQQGIAYLPAPAFLSATSVEATVSQPSQIVELGSGEDRAFTVVHTNMRYPFFAYGYGRFEAQNVNTWSYLYMDRPLYHPTDELKFFGLAQDRNTKKGAGKLQVKLQKEIFLYFDGSGFDAKAYKTVDLETDDAGFFHGQVAWDTLSNGYYRVTVTRDGTVLTSRSFEVREFVKPSYGIEVTTQAPRVYSGEQIKGSVRAMFYDGTPVPKASLELTTSLDGGKGIHQTLITDENGYATFAFTGVKRSCDVNSYYCNRSDRTTITVTPTEGEEGDIVGLAFVEVFGSALLLDGQAVTKGTTATMTYTAHHADLTKDDATGDAWAQLPLKGEVIPTYWEAVQDGTYLDYEEHKVYPRYRYEQRFEPAMPFTLTTDASGKATYTFTMKKDRQYRVKTEGSDGQSRAFRSDLTVAIGWYSGFEGERYGQPYWNPEPVLSLDNAKGNPNGEFSLGEQVGMSYLLGTQTLPVEGTPGTLFITASRGIQKAEVVHASRYQFSFNEQLVPNVEIRGIIFRKGHFLSHNVNAQLRRTDRELTIEATPEQKSYAPGAPVKVNVTVKTKDGKPATRARVAFGAVDKSLLALSYNANEDVLGLLYSYVPSGILFETSSHDANGSLSAFAGGGGGAEMGGDMRAEMQSVLRKNFKDTAAFSVVETDGNGKATLDFRAPDNLTTWRVEMIALTQDLRGATKQTEVAVTRSVFVDVVAPPRLLATDKPVLKLRAYGTGLPEKTALTFYVDAPTLGLKDEIVTGTAGVPTFVTLETLPVGHHVVTIGVKGNGKTDAIERTVDVVATRFLKDQYVSVAAAPGATLPALGAPEADVMITSQARASLIPMLRELSYSGSSARLDRKVASRYATAVLHDQFGLKPESDIDTGSLVSYQSETGGIRLLPYASEDVELAAELAATDASGFDRKAMTAYFWAELDRANENRGLQIQALSGLASLQEPVLARLQTLAEEKDLTWREQLAVARGLMAAGDTERARGLLEQLLKKGEERDGVMQIAVSDKPADRYEATADAAAIAASLAHPKAEALQKFVATNWSVDAFPIFAKVRYIKAALPRLPSADVRVSWTLDGTKEETVVLKDEPVKYLSLTADEAKTFRVTKANGPAEITLVTRIAGRPISVPEVAVSRSYANGHPLDQLQEGDVVRVTLHAEWTKTAQDGCYAVRDHLPGGWEAVLSWRADHANTWYPYQTANGEVSFVVCKDALPATITYLARVVSRGSYTAEAPLLQHLQFPSVAAVGKDQVITIK